jgi:hypothetical protein
MKSQILCLSSVNLWYSSSISTCLKYAINLSELEISGSTQVVIIKEHGKVRKEYQIT